MPGPIIGIDLDNTIIDYAHVFAPVAEQIGLLPAGAKLTSKEAVKARLLGQGGEEAWMRLQGQVYGRFIGQATPYPGCQACIRALRAKGARVVIVSHKTRHGHFDPARIDLWAAALGWLEAQGFIAAPSSGIERADVHFETTRDAKVARIAAVGCRVFIDDLPEVLNHPEFPDGTMRLWFANGRGPEDGGGLSALYGWPEVMDKVVAIL